MKTKKLYYDDPYMKEFDARVLSCEQAGDTLTIVLDQTAFYPEGGGQPADHGKLGPYLVTDVHEKDGIITHRCVLPEGKDGVPSPVMLSVPGMVLHGTLDWERRFDHMQQHSGEHIVSGMLCSQFDCSNVGFHMGEDFVTIDYDKPITKQQLAIIEEEANRYITENHAFVELWPSPEELKNIDYRSKKELTGDVRITSFPGADCCACCGTHVKTSAEVGLVKLFSVHAFREGVRIEMMSGSRARKYLSACYEQNILCSQASSSKPLETGAAVAAMKEEIIRLKGKIIGLEAQIFDHIAESMKGAKSPVYFAGEMEPDAVKKLAVKLAGVAGGRICVFAGSENHYHYVIIEEGADLKSFVAALNAALNGRGGGRGGFAQGNLSATETEIHMFLANP